MVWCWVSETFQWCDHDECVYRYAKPEVKPWWWDDATPQARESYLVNP